MPQTYIEYSDNIKDIDFKDMLRKIHSRAAEVFEVPPDRVKGRIIKYDDYLVGDDDNPNKAFIFIQVCIMSSRTETQKRKIGDYILELLEEIALPALKKQKLVCSPRVEVRDLGIYLFSDWTS